jgi:CBS domain-containing protein
LKEKPNGIFKMLCPACGYENLPGVDFCQECLSSLSHLDATPTKTESRIEKAILKEKVYQILSPPSFMVTPGTSLEEVIKLMVNIDSYSIIIIENNEIKGIFTERSFVRRAASGFPENKDQPIEKFLAENPVVLKSTDKIVNALHLMFVAGYSYAIIDEDPPRVISIKDILKYVIELYPSLAGFDKLIDELKTIALEDGVITKEEQKIINKVEENKDEFLRIFARVDAAGTLLDADRELLEHVIERFIPSIEKVAEAEELISSDEAALLRKLVSYFEENKDRLFV